jgi:hypothetical protein
LKARNLGMLMTVGSWLAGQEGKGVSIWINSYPMTASVLELWYTLTHEILTSSWLHLLIPYKWEITEIKWKVMRGFRHLLKVTCLASCRARIWIQVCITLQLISYAMGFFSFEKSVYQAFFLQHS